MALDIGFNGSRFGVHFGVHQDIARVIKSEGKAVAQEMNECVKADGELTRQQSASQHKETMSEIKNLKDQMVQVLTTIEKQNKVRPLQEKDLLTDCKRSISFENDNDLNVVERDDSIASEITTPSILSRKSSIATRTRARSQNDNTVLKLKCEIQDKNDKLRAYERAPKDPTVEVAKEVPLHHKEIDAIQKDLDRKEMGRRLRAKRKSYKL
eukprot:scaffold7863_cov37-Cyclotella_meneghiniana.AAC.16